MILPKELTETLPQAPAATTHKPSSVRPPSAEGLQALKDSLLLDLTVFALTKPAAPRHQIWPTSALQFVPRGRVRSASPYGPRYIMAYDSEQSVRDQLDLLEEEFPLA